MQTALKGPKIAAIYPTKKKKIKKEEQERFLFFFLFLSSDPFLNVSSCFPPTALKESKTFLF